MTEYLQWTTEWAVEVTWKDWRKAGAEGPTSQYGPFTDSATRQSFVEYQLRDDAVTAVRILERQAMYTPWIGEEPMPISKQMRNDAKMRLWESVNGKKS